MYVFVGINNTTAFGRVMQEERTRFLTLYKRKAMLHHYTEYMEQELIATADMNVSRLITDYEQIENGTFTYQNRQSKSHQNTHTSSSNSSSGSGSKSRRSSTEAGLNESGMNKLYPAF